MITHAAPPFGSRGSVAARRGPDQEPVEGVLRALQERGVVEVVGRGEGLGRPLLYGTTRLFLELLGLNSRDDLPRLEEFAEVLGLKPGELELAVEGAESVAEVHDDEEIPLPFLAKIMRDLGNLPRGGRR